MHFMSQIVVVITFRTACKSRSPNLLNLLSFICCLMSQFEGCFQSTNVFMLATGNEKERGTKDLLDFVLYID